MKSGFWGQVYQFFIANLWLIKLLAVFVIALLVSWLVNLLYRYVHPRLQKSKFTWDDNLAEAVIKPLLYCIWGLALTIVIPIVLARLAFATNTIPYFDVVRQLVIVFTAFWFAIRFVRFFETTLVARIDRGNGKGNRTSIHAIAQISRALLIISTALIVMSTVGIKIGTLLAFGGVSTVVIGFAAKDTLSNFFGGMMIYWDRPFAVGDWIRSPDRNIEGTVEYIGWRSTRIRTFDKRPLYVPNGVFLTISVENPSRMTNRRIKTMVGLRYMDAPKMDVVVKEIKNMLKNHHEIDQQQTMLVYFNEFGPSSLNILIYTFTKTTNWAKYLEVQQDVYLKIIGIITEHGAECAFPTRTLNIPEGLMVQQKVGELEYERSGVN